MAFLSMEIAKQDGARLNRHQSRWRKLLLLLWAEAKQKQIIISTELEGPTGVARQQSQ